MSEGTAVAPRASAELTPADQEELAVAAGAIKGLDDVRPTVPVLKLTQALTAEVAEGDAESGHYVNALTGEDLGDKIEFVVVAAYKGRFYKRTKRDKDLPGEINKVYVANEDTVPDNWPEEWQGQRFSDLPEAEEQYRVRVQNEEIEWGSGPAIRTTLNFIGFRPEEPDLPLRLSLMRSSAPAGRKILDIARASGTPWRNVFELSTDSRTSDDGPYYVVSAKRGRQATAEERTEALNLSKQIQGQGFTPAGDEALDESGEKAKAAAKDTGGISVT